MISNSAKTTRSHRNIALTYMVLIATFSIQNCTVAEPSVQISTARNSLAYGDPLAVDLRLTFEEPQMSGFGGGVSTVVRIGWLVLRIEKEGSSEVALFPSRMPISFTLRDSDGLSYGASVIVWCDVHKEPEGWIEKMAFEKPGDYKLAYLREGKEVSNALSIQVEASHLGEKGLSLMGPESRVYLLDGIYKSPETMSMLQEVVKKCNGTVLAQMAAARLGLEYFRQFHERHPSFQNFKIEYQQGKTKEPLLKDARKYLALGTQLPVGFPIRERVLYELARVEVIENNYETAFSVVDDLIMNYPHGKYGKRAVSGKEEIERQRQRELAMAPAVSVTPSWQSRLLWMVGVVVVIAAVLMILVIKKKRLAHQ